MCEEKLQEILELESELSYFIDSGMSIDKKIKILENSYWRAHHAGYCDYMAGRRMAGVDDEQTQQHDMDCKHKWEVERLLVLLHEQRDEEARRKDEEAWRKIDAFFEEDKEKAFSAWLELSNAGNARSTRTVAWCYQNGEGTEKNIEKAKEYYSLAAKQGYFYSYVDLYWLAYEEGDKEKALELLFEGAKNDVAESYELLFRECFYGNIFGGNLKAAAYLAARAYELDKACGGMLALCYLNGYFFPQVYSYAKYCIEKSGRTKNDFEADGNIFPDYWDEIKPVPPSYPEFDITLADCETVENPIAIMEKAREYMIATPPDYEKAKPCVLEAARAGYSYAMYCTYLLNIDGLEVWQVKGADEYGDLDCIEMLATLFSDCAYEHTKDPYLSEASEYWGLRSRLHGSVPMKETVLRSYEKYLQMINETDA
ncbi:MAG: sel1 repeat family protein [Clostridia bacterium]|nr:sel1 repeat family protein [Clostridia bacterium]